jgi:uncharacterized protein DUF5335
MPTARHLPRETWARSLADLTAERRGAPVVLVVDWEAEGEEVEAHDVLLESLAYDERGDAVSVIARRPSPTGFAMLRHVVDKPIAVDVDSPAGIVPRVVRIEGGDGARTIVTITPTTAVSE